MNLINGLEISNLMKQESPVFILGAPRSGTSILYRVLQKHSSFKPKNCQDATGVDLTESRVFREPYSVFSTTSQAFEYLLCDNNYHEKFTELSQYIQNRQRLILGKTSLHKILSKFQWVKFRETVWKLNYNDLLLQLFFYYAKQARGSNRIIEKTPQHIFHIPEIKSTFPQAKLLFIYRHPVDVFSSYKKKLKVQQNLGFKYSELRWLEIKVNDFCNLYARNINLALAEETSNPEQLKCIKYEDFVNNLPTAIEQILFFLGETYEEQCIPENETHKLDWKVTPSLFDQVKTRTKNWSDYIDEYDAQLIEKKLTKIIEKLNYSRYA
jgi:hypothetical protein